MNRLNRVLHDPTVKRLGAECIRGEYKSFDRWYEAFQKELAKQSGTGVIPKGMDKESYRESFDDLLEIELPRS